MVSEIFERKKKSKLGKKSYLNGYVADAKAKWSELGSRYAAPYITIMVVDLSIVRGRTLAAMSLTVCREHSLSLAEEGSANIKGALGKKRKQGITAAQKKHQALPSVNRTESQT